MPKKSLRCAVLGCKFTRRLAVGRLFDVCARCGRSRTYRFGGDDA